MNEKTLMIFTSLKRRWSNTSFSINSTRSILSFDANALMNSYIQRIIQRNGNSVTVAAPVMNAMTLQDDRITVTYEREVSLPGPTIDIHKTALYHHTSS